jgi:hypothetical protein
MPKPKRKGVGIMKEAKALEAITEDYLHRSSVEGMKSMGAWYIIFTNLFIIIWLKLIRKSCRGKSRGDKERPGRICTKRKKRKGIWKRYR